jgi:non-canonical poly(A) RNA polymerase PAPD5/7
MTTRFGFDSDLALGGHNGMDTSQYVKKLIQKYDSYATVVLFLKILLQQTSLDKPFTGGLGSYKLYVLVANHVSIIECNVPA